MSEKFYKWIKRICAEKEGGVSVVKRRKRRSKRVYNKADKKEIY